MCFEITVIVILIWLSYILYVNQDIIYYLRCLFKVKLADYLATFIATMFINAIRHSNQSGKSTTVKSTKWSPIYNRLFYRKKK